MSKTETERTLREETPDEVMNRAIDRGNDAAKGYDNDKPDSGHYDWQKLAIMRAAERDVFIAAHERVWRALRNETPEEHGDEQDHGQRSPRESAGPSVKAPTTSPPPVPSSVDEEMARIDKASPYGARDCVYYYRDHLRKALEENQDLDEHNLKMADAYAKDIGDLKHRAEKAERLYNTVEGTVGRLTQENELLESLVNRLEAESAKLRKMLREGVVLTDFLVGKSYSPAPGLAAWNKRVRALLTDKKGRVR